IAAEANLQEPQSHWQSSAPVPLTYKLKERALGAPALAAFCLADNRLNLDVYLDGCRRFLQLFEGRRGEVLQVEFLRLSSNDRLLGTTLDILPHLKHLKSLVIKGGHARDEFGSCQHGSLTSLPADMGNLRCLTHLDLTFNSLSTLPSCILHLSSLRVLLVSHNRLVVLPEDFGCLSKLTFFSAMKNQLKDLPRSIGDLAVLQDLDLSENALEFIPEEVGNLHNCTELDLSGNCLSSIPDSLANLKCLRRLHLHSNLLVTVPASLARLPNLSRLDLQNNCLRAVPPEIQTLPFVRLRGNPLGETEPSPQAGNCKASAALGSDQLLPHSAQHGVDGFGLENTSRGESDQAIRCHSAVQLPPDFPGCRGASPCPRCR
uniref:P53-induced death domain protein 1 n=1 Tax=Amazona collaria TaxID=241587 RepID=A0A8B9GDN0_9PSIT